MDHYHGQAALAARRLRQARSRAWERFRSRHGGHLSLTGSVAFGLFVVGLLVGGWPLAIGGGAMLIWLWLLALAANDSWEG
jgi:hypothetical protein